MELGQRLKETRQNAGLKQEEPAKQLGVSRQTISNWENGRADPMPNLGRVDVIGSAKMKLTVAGLPEETLTLTEEYHHGAHTETTVYQLLPKKPGSFTMKLETRYDGEEEWALYRIPYEEGEYRFLLVFG